MVGYELDAGDLARGLKRPSRVPFYSVMPRVRSMFEPLIEVM